MHSAKLQMTGCLRATFLGLGWLSLAANVGAVEPLKFVETPQLARQPDKSYVATFALNRAADVEVAIIDTQSQKVVRHLAAGLLGNAAPAPLVRGVLAQRIDWDGKDDFRRPITDPMKLAVRVRVGMRVKLVQMVGGDPYTFFSADMPHGDHSPWGINGVELKPDGSVYVLGHSSTLGPPAVRQYDIDGDFLKTVFPPPAGKSVEAMAGWGINVKEDGTYTPKFSRLTDPSVSTTFLDGATNNMARLLPTSDSSTLSFWNTSLTRGSLDLMTINADGTLSQPSDKTLPGKLVLHPSLESGPIAPNSHINHSFVGPVFTCLAPNGKHFYLSGIFLAQTRYGSILEVKKEGFWRDGQVWKVDFETRTAKPFFALEAASVAASGRDRKSAIGGTQSYAALHGVAVDQEGRVFICDRLNQRIVILDAKGKPLRQLPLANPDALAISGRTGVLYVTTRVGDEYNGRGEVHLVKFNDRRKDAAPATRLLLCQTGYTDHHKQSYVVLCEKSNATNVWVAYTELPVRIYRDDAQGLELVKEFNAIKNSERCAVFDRIAVDSANEDVFVLDDHDSVWRIRGWDHPRITKLPIRSANVAVDPWRRHLVVRTLQDGSSSNAVGKLARFNLDDPQFSPANFGDSGTNRFAAPLKYEWCFTGNGDKGFAIARNGNVAVVGDPDVGLRLFHGSESSIPWTATRLADLPNTAGGAQFDLSGNLYVGYIDKPSPKPAAEFENDRFGALMGRIHKFAPTGTMESGNLFPRPPTPPVKSYGIRYGAFDADCIIRTPRFAVDGYGRIYYPTNIEQKVTVIDNAGNELVNFGTYGNRDSLGGLPGDLVPTRGIPLGFPNSVAATDDYIYVGDMMNHRLVRVEKRFEAEAIGK